MFRTILAALMWVTLAFGSVEAAAQYAPTGSRIQQESPADAVPADEARRVREAMGDCIFKRHPDEVRTVLENSDMVGLKPGTSLAKLRMDGCLEDELTTSDLQMKLSILSLHGMFAERAYLAANPTPPDWLKTSFAIDKRRYFAKGDDLKRAQGVGFLVDCLVTAAPVRADTLLRSSAGSTEELAAVRALAEPLGGCLFEGQEMAVTAASVRTWVAAGLWQAERHRLAGSSSAAKSVN